MSFTLCTMHNKVLPVGMIPFVNEQCNMTQHLMTLSLTAIIIKIFNGTLAHSHRQTVRQSTLCDSTSFNDKFQMTKYFEKYFCLFFIILFRLLSVCLVTPFEYTAHFQFTANAYFGQMALRCVFNSILINHQLVSSGTSGLMTGHIPGWHFLCDRPYLMTQLLFIHTKSNNRFENITNWGIFRNEVTTRTSFSLNRPKYQINKSVLEPTTTTAVRCERESRQRYLHAELHIYS